MAVAVDFDPARPWVRQPFDSDLSWALFQEYLTLPLPRRTVDLARRPGCPLSAEVLARLAWEDGWTARAQAFDRHLDQLRIQAVEQVVQEDAKQRAERQGRAGRKLARMGELEIDRVTKLLERNPEHDSGALPIRDAIRAIGIGVRVERLALGDTTEKVDVGPDLSALSVEDLRRLREIQQKAGTENG